MKLLFSPPPETKFLLDKLFDGEKILACFPWDIGENAVFERGFFALSSKKCVVVRGGEHLRTVNTAKELKFTVEQCDGDGGALLYTDGEENSYEVCRFSGAHMHRYRLAASAMTAFCEEDEYDMPPESSDNICAACGAPLLRGQTTCARCRKSSEVLKRLWELTVGLRLRYIVLMAAMFFSLALNIINPILQRNLVDGYINAENPPSSRTGFYIILSAMFIIIAFDAAQGIVRSLLANGLGNRFVLNLRNLLFAKIQELSLSSVAKKTVGDLMHRLGDDVYVVRDTMVYYAPDLVYQLAMFFGIAALLFVKNPLIAVFVIAPAPIVFFAITRINAMAHKRFHWGWIKMRRISTYLHDIFSGIRVVKSFGREKQEIDRFEKIAYDATQTALKNEYFWNFFMMPTNFLLGIGEFFILYFCGKYILAGTMSIGEMVQYSAYASMIYGPMRWLSRAFRQMTRFSVSAGKVFEVIDELPEIADVKDPVEREIEGVIRFENVSFGYYPYKNVLDNVSFEVNPGEMVGIIGHSGVGKSTLINLLLRLYDVTDGRITIDGIDLRNYGQTSLRRQMGAVLQDTYLFAGTIIDNIRYPKPDATREEIINASKVAGAHDFIMKLPAAYQTYVGEKGYTLSGGERQRVAIARAILHDPKIIILDEATSALDTETEKQIQDALAILVKGRTTFAIAHRLSTLRNANRLIVLHKGRLAETGSHEELMRQRGLYFSLVMAQRVLTKMKDAVPIEE